MEYLLPLLGVFPDFIRNILAAAADMVAHCVFKVHVLHGESLFDTRRYLMTREKNETLAEPLVLGLAVVEARLKAEDLFDRGHSAEREPAIASVVILFISGSYVS